MRCSRCGHEAGNTDNFCAECGAFLRDAYVDERLLLALSQERILLRETSEPFAVKCIKDIFKQGRKLTRAEIDSAEALNEEFEI